MRKLKIKTYEMCGDYYNEMKEIYNQSVISKGGTLHEKICVIDYLIKFSDVGKLLEMSNMGFYTACAFVDNKLAGYAILSEKDDGQELYISLIAVDKKFQGRGIGKALMNYAIHHSKGYARITSGAFLKNTASVRLHEKVGFSKDSVSKYRGSNGELEGELYLNFVRQLPRKNSSLTLEPEMA